MPHPNQGPKLDYRADRGQFYITWSEGGRSRRLTTGTGDRETAHIALAEFIRDRQQQSQPVGPSAPSEFPIDQALDLYGQQHAPTTEVPERIGYAIEALLPFWQHSGVGDITEATCRAYGRWRERSDGTVRKELGVLRAAVNFAHRHGRITSAPYVFLPDKPEGKSRWLTHSEAAALVRAARRARSTAGLSYATSSRGYLPLFILLALHTGARKEALLSLRWPQVDLDRGVIDLNPAGRRRTAKGRAVIPTSRPADDAAPARATARDGPRLRPPPGRRAHPGREEELRSRLSRRWAGRRHTPHPAPHVRHLARAKGRRPLGGGGLARADARPHDRALRSPPSRPLQGRQARGRPEAIVHVGRIMGALRTSVHVLFAGSKPERARKNGGNAWGSSPPKAEATGSNPVGCTSFSANF